MQQIIEQIKSGKENVILASNRTFRASFKAPVNSGRLLQCFLNSDMRNGHLGLAELAKKNDIDITKLQPGQYVAFINAERNKLKVYAANNVLAYLALPAGRKLDLNTIRLIPQAFKGGTIDYDSALKETIEAALRRRNRKSAEKDSS